MKIRILFFFTSIIALNIFAAVIPSLAPLLMESTFKIEGTSLDGNSSIGSCFIFLVDDPANTNKSRITLVTANHVLSDIGADTATLHLRKKLETGAWKELPVTIPIRTQSVPLWTRHPEADVAAIFVSLPKDIVDSQRWLDAGLLAGDDVFKDRDIQPGDELMCLGYPLNIQANDSGFPILRSGRIASYPVWPSSTVKTFLYDIPIYGGNSGGPVFFDYRNRRIPGEDFNKTVDIIGIAGLISKDVSSTVHVESYFETSTRRDPLGLAVVVPAEFIRQTIDILVKTISQPQQSVAGPLPTIDPR